MKLSQPLLVFLWLLLWMFKWQCSRVKMVTTNYSNGFTSPVFRQTYRMWWVQELLQIHAGMHFPLDFIYMISPLFRSYKNLFECCPVCIVVECDMTKDVECSKCLLRKETAMDSCIQITQTLDASPAEFDATAATICLQHSSTIFGCFAIHWFCVGVSWKETYNFALKRC